MKVSDFLRATRKLIQEPETWCQFTYCKAKDGTKTWVTLADAVVFCASGALLKAAHDSPGNDDVRGKAYALLLKTMKQIAPLIYEMAHYNDTHSHAEVLAAFDQAIVAAEEQEKQE